MANANTTTKGFVLSFSLFVMGIFLILYAQLYAENGFEQRMDSAVIWEDSSIARFALDAQADLNRVLDQFVSLDQNETNGWISIRGRLPSLLDVEENIQSYRDDLVVFGRDVNILVTMDLTDILEDGNVMGHADNSFWWKEKLDTSRIQFWNENVLGKPTQIDININVESQYVDVNAWVLDDNGNILVNLSYADQNTQHAFTSSGYISDENTVAYHWIFDDGASGVTLQLGKINGINGSGILDTNDSANLALAYSFRFTFDANTAPTRLGYDIPLSLSGKNATMQMSTQWVEGG
ncbi:MAG: hypothetical protein V1776_01645 [Candidatus Diapherotrites archaeon]